MMKNVNLILNLSIIATFIAMFFIIFNNSGVSFFVGIGITVFSLIIYLSRMFFDTDSKKLSISILSMCIIVFNLFLLNFLKTSLNQLFIFAGFMGIFSLVLAIVMLKEKKPVKIKELPKKKSRKRKN